MVHVDFPQSVCRLAIAIDDITPPVGTYHRMWGAATHDRSEGVHKPLRLTVVVMAPNLNGEGRPSGVDSDQNAGRPLVMVSLDHCLVGRPELALLLEEVRHLETSGQIPSTPTPFRAEDVVLLFSHTHGAGLMTLDRLTLPGGEGIADYLRLVGRKMAKLIVEAFERLRPATLAYATGRCGLAAHRDFWDAERRQFVCGFNPQAPGDDTLLVVRATDECGDTLATFVNYACHPTTLAWDNRKISPDYVGAMREVVEGATGAPCLFIQGASGELGPVDGYTGDTEVADRNGRQLGFAALSAWESLPPPQTRFSYVGPVISGATIGVWRYMPWDSARGLHAATWHRRRWTIPLEYRPELPTIDAAVAEKERLERAEAAARAAGNDAAARDLRAMTERQTRLVSRLRQLPDGERYPLEVELRRMGDAWWLCVPGEHYSLLQTELRRRFPGTPLIIATLANGWGPSYLPTRETYGKGIYQESIAIVAPGSLEQIVEEVSRALSGD